LEGMYTQEAAVCPAPGPIARVRSTQDANVPMRGVERRQPMAECPEPDRRATLRIAQDLLRVHVPAVRNDIRRLTERGVAELVLDLAEVDVLDEAGLALLVAAHNTQRQQGGRVSLAHVNQDVRRFLGDMLLDGVLEIQLD